MPHAKAELRWWERAIVSTLVGLTFSLVLSVVIAAALALRAPWAMAVEHAGGDLGMQIASVAPGPPAGAGAPPLVFVDVDVATCVAFGGSEAACRTANPIGPCLVLDFARAASEGGARMILIDADLSRSARQPLPAACADRAQPGRTLGQALAGLPGAAPIVAPLAARPTGQGAAPFAAARADNLLDGLALGRLRLAAFVTLPDREGFDDMTREVPLFVRLKWDAGAGPAAAAPSASYLAALAGRPRDLAAADCAFYGLGCRLADPKATVALRRTLAAPSPAAPVFYRFRSLARTEGEADCGAPRRLGAARSLACRYAGAYERHAASQVRDGARFIASEYYAPRDRPAVAILGSSLPSALDLQPSPLGLMSGSEVMVNAIDSLRAGPAPGLDARPPREGPGMLQRFWEIAHEKALAALVASPLVMLGWLAIHRLMDGPAAHPWRGLARRALCAVLFVAVLAAAAALELKGLMPALANPQAHGERIDLLWPVLALGLEGYAEASVWLVHQIEPLFEALVAATAGFGTPAVRWLGKLWGKTP